MPNQYATTAEYLAHIGEPRATGDRQPKDTDAEITSLLQAASHAIDEYTHRTFTTGVSSSERSYFGNGTKYLQIDPCWDGVTVTDSAGTTIDADNYRLSPVNEDQQWMLVRASGRWQSGVEYKVTSKYGIEALPPEVKQATIEYAKIFNLKSPRARGTGAASLGDDIPVTSQAQMMLKAFLQKWVLPEIGTLVPTVY